MLLSLLFACAKPDDEIFTLAEVSAAIKNVSYKHSDMTSLDLNQDAILQRSELIEADDKTLAELYNAIVSNNGIGWSRGSPISVDLEKFITDVEAKNSLIEMPTPAVTFPKPQL